MRLNLKKLFLLSCLFVCSCQSAKKKWKSDDLIISDEISFVYPKTLSEEQAKEDIDFLIYALSKGYGGRNYAPKNDLSKALNELRRIPQTSSLEQFRDQIDEALLLIPDNHLKARLNAHPSQKRLAERKIARVGKNNITNYQKIWETRIDKVGQKKILFISITDFAPHEDSLWNGFLSSIKSKLKLVDTIVMDMRGNGGGDDSIGMELAEILYGHSFEYPVSRIYRSQAPETVAFTVNGLKLDRARIQKEGANIPDYLTARLKKATDEYALASNGQLLSVLIRTNKGTGKRTDPITGFKKPIFILMDARCASSCESTILAFEWHTGVKKVGENTAGFIHFGNIGFIVLPNSKIEVMIPTQYSEFYDGRFIEKIGITPDIHVPSGEDAYDSVKKSFL